MDNEAFDQAVEVLVAVAVRHNGGPFNDLAAQFTLEMLMRDAIREAVIEAVTQTTAVWKQHEAEWRQNPPQFGGP